jgi:hypothetical protein
VYIYIYIHIQKENKKIHMLNFEGISTYNWQLSYVYEFCNSKCQSLKSFFVFKEDTVLLQLSGMHLFYCVSVKTNVISTSNKQVPCISTSVISVIQNWIKEFVHYFVPEMLSYRIECPLMTLVLIRYVVLCNGSKSLHSACYFNTNTIRLYSKFSSFCKFSLDLHFISSATC